MKNIVILLLLAGATMLAQAQTADSLQYRILKGYLRNHDRQEIHIPDILGYKTIKADLHLHTHQSDGNVTPRFRVYEAYEEGLDAIAITDHQASSRYNHTTDGNISHLQAVLAAQQKHITLIRGAEVTAISDGPHYKDVGHLNFLFTSDNNRYYPQSADRDITPAIADSLLARAQTDSVWVTSNHPGWPDKDSELSAFIIRQMRKGRVQGIEIFNDQEFYPRAIDYIYDYNLAPIGGTDCHFPIAYRFDLTRAHRDLTLIFARDNSEAAIREAMFARRTVAYADNVLAGRQEFVEAIVRQSVSMQPQPKKRGRNIEVTFTNKSDIPYTLIEPESHTTLMVAPLSATTALIPAHCLERTWMVQNVYIRSAEHLAICLASLQSH